jgi:hypothetical protein
MVREPTLYIYKGKFKTKTEFEDLSMEYSYTVGDKQFDIFPKWRRDPEKRAYDELVCIPYNPRESDPTPPNVLNEAAPFKFEYIPMEERSDAIADFKHILKHTCSSEETQTYMLQYFAHILQFPNVNPQVAPVMKGHLGGTGKDSVIKTATALVGDFYVTSTDDMERVFGHFNSLLDKKLIVQLNEAEGSQGSRFISKIKGHVTQDVNHIKEEHIKPRAQKNNVRFIVNSNNLNPIPEDRCTPIIQT